MSVCYQRGLPRLVFTESAPRPIQSGAKTENPLLIFPFFPFWKCQANFDAHFWRHTCFCCCSFAVVLLCISPFNMWRVKDTLSIQISVLSLPELEFHHSRKPEKNCKTKIVYDYQVSWSNSFIVYKSLPMNPWTPFLKNRSLGRFFHRVVDQVRRCKEP